MALQAATSPVLAIIFRFSLALRSEIKTEGFASHLDKPFPDMEKPATAATGGRVKQAGVCVSLW